MNTLEKRVDELDKIAEANGYQLIALMKTIDVNICQNDDQGNWTANAVQVCFADLLVTFESRYFTEGSTIGRKERPGKLDAITVNRKLFCYQSMIEWAGNMYWNLYRFDMVTATGLLNTLWRSDDWGWNDINSDLLALLETGAPVLPGDLEELILITQ